MTQYWRLSRDVAQSVRAPRLQAQFLSRTPPPKGQHPYFRTWATLWGKVKRLDGGTSKW